MRSDNKNKGLNKALKWTFGLSAGTLALPFILGATTALSPGLVSEPLVKKLEEQDIKTAFMRNIEQENIRLYDRGHWLVPFHIASRGQSYTASFQQGIADLARSARLSKYAQTYTGRNKDICYIYGPKKAPANRYIREFTGIPESHLGNFGNRAGEELYSYIIRHEAKHCDFFNDMKTMLGEEFKNYSQNELLAFSNELMPDIFAIRSIEEENPDSNIRDMVKYIRAVTPFSRPDKEFLYDRYAIALELELAEEGALRRHSDIVRANRGLHKLIRDNVSQRSGEAYYLSVYRTLKTMLDEKQIHGPLKRRAAELYIEGIDYLADNAPGLGNKTKVASHPAYRP